MNRKLLLALFSILFSLTFSGVISAQEIGPTKAELLSLQKVKAKIGKKKPDGNIYNYMDAEVELKSCCTNVHDEIWKGKTVFSMLTPTAFVNSADALLKKYDYKLTANTSSGKNVKKTVNTNKTKKTTNPTVSNVKEEKVVKEEVKIDQPKDDSNKAGTGSSGATTNITNNYNTYNFGKPNTGFGSGNKLKVDPIKINPTTNANVDANKTNTTFNPYATNNKKLDVPKIEWPKNNNLFDKSKLSTGTNSGTALNDEKIVKTDEANNTVIENMDQKVDTDFETELSVKPLFVDVNSTGSCKDIKGDKAEDNCKASVYYISTSVCPETNPLCFYHKNAYANCAQENASLTLPEREVKCAVRSCEWVSSKKLCLSKEALTFPQLVGSEESGLVNHPFAAVTSFDKDAIKKKFLSDINGGDLYLKNLDICNFEGGTRYATTCSLPSTAEMLHAYVDITACSNFAPSDLLYSTIAQNGQMQSCNVAVIYIGKGAVPPAEDAITKIYVYNDKAVGFLPFVKDADNANLWTFDGTIDKMKRGSAFCKEIDARFDLQPDALTAWSMLGLYDLVAKGDLKIGNKEFPSSMAQFLMLRTSCNEQNKRVQTWANKEQSLIKSYLGGNNAKAIIQTNIYRVACTPGSKELNTIPQMYKDALAGKSSIRAFCDSVEGEAAKVNVTAMMKLENLFINSADAAKEQPKVVAGKGMLEYYLLGVNALSKPMSKKELRQVNKQIKKEQKLAKRGTCKTPKTWWKNFTCSIGPEAVAGIIMGGLAIANFIWDMEKWKEELAWQRKMFEEGQCYPYKNDTSGVTIPFTIAGHTVNYSMYDFCRLTASGALAYMDPCGSLIASGAPQAAIDACYGIQARQLNTNVQYGNASGAGVSGSKAPEKEEEKKKEEKKDAPASTAGAGAGGAAAGGGSGAAADKKQKSPWESVYRTPYDSSSGTKGFSDRPTYPYAGGPYEQNNANTSANRPTGGDKKYENLPGSTIGDLVTGHQTTIESNISGKK